MEYVVPEYHLKVLQHHIHICYMNYSDSHLLKVLPQQRFRPAVLTVLFKYRWVSKEWRALLSLCAALTFVLFLGYFWTMAFHHAAIREFIKISYCRYGAPLSVAAICSTRGWSDDYFMWLAQSSCLSGICSAVYPSSVPGCRIIVIIFRGGKKPLVHIVSSQVFAGFRLPVRSSQGVSAQCRHRLSKLRPLFQKYGQAEGVVLALNLFFLPWLLSGNGGQLHPLPLMYWNPHPPLHPAPPL